MSLNVTSGGVTPTPLQYDTYADLPQSATPDSIAYVRATTGVAFINRKTKGFYRYTGSSWVSAEEASVESSVISFDRSGTTLTSNHVQGAINEIYQIASDPTVTKADVGLDSVDNTADLDKPVSTATAAAILANTHPAFIETVSLPNITINATADVVLSGTGFLPNTVFNLGPQITINSTTINSGRQATLNITASGTAATSIITATNNGVSSFSPTAISVVTATILTPGTTATPWTNVSSGVTTGVGRFEAAGTNAWNKQAIFGSIPAALDGYLEFRYVGTPSGTLIMVGLAINPTADANHTSIDYAIYIQSNGVHSVREKGAIRGTFGSFSPGDLFSISRNYSAVSYAINGTTYYTSPVNTSAELFFDCSIYSGADFEDIRIVY